MVDIIAGVDGTGPTDNGEYAVDFAKSFVNRLCAMGSDFRHRDYRRGPSWHGRETEGLAISAAAFATAAYKQASRAHDLNLRGFDAAPRIFLTGYSRGGAAVIEAANRLEADGIPVACLLLFDAVDKSSLTKVDVIPSNVALCYHARRSPHAKSREFFGNCGTRAARGVAYYEKFFHCTHGALGGTPWKTVGSSGKIEELSTGQSVGVRAVGSLFGPVGSYAANSWATENDLTNVTLAQENAGSAEVWKWMSANLRKAQMPPVAGLAKPMEALGRSAG